MTNYTNCITLEQMEYLDLFDNIPYKVVKKIVKLDDETDFEVEIKDLPNDSGYMCSTSFKFTLEIDISQGSLPLMVEKHYCVIKEYNSSSPMAMFIDENLAYPTDEEEEEEEEEEKEYTIEIPVVGLGYCRYYDKEDRDKYVVYCKNAVWKMKGDKTARDMEGNYCETESEEEEEEEEEEE
jgi:hypothetical protein